MNLGKRRNRCCWRFKRDHAADAGIDQDSRKLSKEEIFVAAGYSIRMWDQRRGKEALHYG